LPVIFAQKVLRWLLFAYLTTTAADAHQSALMTPTTRSACEPDMLGSGPSLPSSLLYTAGTMMRGQVVATNMLAA
jgi:hypothetical protein